MQRNSKHWKSVGFTQDQHHLLQIISKALCISFVVAMEFAFDHRVLHLARGASFFQHKIVASPGSRLAFDDVWAAFQTWCRSHRFKGQIGVDDFAAMVHAICYLRNIAVRVRGNQVFCIDVRLRA
jgi:hypothetical protein